MRAFFSRLGAYLPIAFFAALAALTYWLDLSTRPEEMRKSPASRHTPDTVVEDFETRRYGAEGSLLHRLRAAAMRHYAEDERSEIDRPEFFWQREPPLRLTARRARVRGNGEIVEFFGQVTLVREADAKRPAIRMTSEHLLVWPEEERAQTDTPVRIEEGASWITGARLTADHKTGLYALAGPVRGEFRRREKSAQVTASTVASAAIVSPAAASPTADGPPPLRPAKSAKPRRKKSR